MNFTLNDNAVNFELGDRTDFLLGATALNFKLNAISSTPSVQDCLRLLEDGFFRLLEDTSFRLLEQCAQSTGNEFDYTLDFTFE